MVDFNRRPGYLNGPGGGLGVRYLGRLAVPPGHPCRVEPPRCVEVHAMSSEGHEAVRRPGETGRAAALDGDARCRC